MNPNWTQKKINNLKFQILKFTKKSGKIIEPRLLAVKYFVLYANASAYNLILYIKSISVVLTKFKDLEGLRIWKQIRLALLAVLTSQNLIRSI